MLLEPCTYQFSSISGFVLNADVLSEHGAKNAHSGIQAWAQTPALPLSSSVTWRNLFGFSEPRLPHPSNGDDHRAYVKGSSQ